VTRTLSARELASETDGSVEVIDWLTRIGILQTRTPQTYTFGDAFRVKMILSLLGAGFTHEDIEAAVASAGLDLRHVDRYVILEPNERSARTFAEFARSLGPRAPDVLPGIYQLLGLAEPDPASHLPVDEETLLRDLLHVWSLADTDDTPSRAARLLGDGTRTVVAGWADLLNERIAGPARDRWLRKEVAAFPPEVADAAANLYMLLPRFVPWLIQRYIEQIVTSGIADSFEDVLASRGLAPAPPPAGPPAVAFVDISDYTTVTEQRGDDVAVRIATALQRHAERAAADRHGRVVKLLGDGAMMEFREVSSAVEASIDLVRTMTATLGVAAHARVHAGPVIERDRDLFGSTVNLAARVSSAAGPGEVLVTEVVTRLMDADTVRFEEIDPTELKGVSQPLRLFRVAGS